MCVGFVQHKIIPGSHETHADCTFDSFIQPAHKDGTQSASRQTAAANVFYINIGSAENFRYYWDGNWIIGDPAWIKKKYEGYQDEFYVEFWNPEWQKIIYGNNNSYMKKILDAGFDGAYLDNVEAYYFLYNK